MASFWRMIILDRVMVLLQIMANQGLPGKERPCPSAEFMGIRRTIPSAELDQWRKISTRSLKSLQ
jgi:hypothetical protein